MRRVFVVLSSRSSPYATVCIETLLNTCSEPVSLTLVADDPEDGGRLGEMMDGIATNGHEWRIIDKTQCDIIAAERFKSFPGLQAFRNGHPCWRKITEPLLLSAPTDEVIILDPDLYFPNRFAFEPTPTQGIMVMRQRPNCLLPPEAVWRVFSLDVPLARHVDIGIAQLTCGAIDLEWLDWLLQHMDLETHRPFMHIEAIIWSALAMHHGGGHLNPKAWRCWERGYIKRLAVAVHAPGHLMLRLEPLHNLKCIHVSGRSKWWVIDAVKSGALKPFGNTLTQATEVVPYIEMTKDWYSNEQMRKAMLKKIMPTWLA